MTRESELTREQKCEAILRKIIETANEGTPVTLSDDWGGYTATLEIEGKGHTHVGCPGDDAGMPDGSDAQFNTLVRDLYNQFHGGPGLSWA